MEAFFLEHEGYFGALGAFLESAFGDKIDEVLLSSVKKTNLNDEEHEGEALRFVSNKASMNRRDTISNDPRGDSPHKKKSWRELFHNFEGNNSSPTQQIRRLRTQSLDSHDMTQTPLRSPKPN